VATRHGDKAVEQAADRAVDWQRNGCSVPGGGGDGKGGAVDRGGGGGVGGSGGPGVVPRVADLAVAEPEGERAEDWRRDRHKQRTGKWLAATAMLKGGMTGGVPGMPGAAGAGGAYAVAETMCVR